MTITVITQHCARCNGLLMADRDVYGAYVLCRSCGREPLPEGGVLPHPRVWKVTHHKEQRRVLCHVCGDSIGADNMGKHLPVHLRSGGGRHPCTRCQLWIRSGLMAAHRARCQGAKQPSQRA